jgi:hypothetical protein
LCRALLSNSSDGNQESRQTGKEIRSQTEAGVLQNQGLLTA